MKEQIKQHLQAARPWQDFLIWFDTIDSTNTQAKLLAAQGAPEGTVLIADLQTGGRGRRGRSFHSPAGSGIYMSVILRPNCPPERLMHLTCGTAVAMCDAVENSCDFRPGIKWTNDLVFGKRKLGGILTELGLSPNGTVDYAIIGVGINCCQKESDFPEEIRAIAASLETVSAQKVHRAKVAAAMMDAFFRLSQTLLTEKETIMERYRRDCITLGQYVSVVKADGSARHGTAMDIDSEGALIVQFDDKTLETVNSGEVSVRGMYGYV